MVTGKSFERSDYQLAAHKTGHRPRACQQNDIDLH
jgi:hypothetical protein